MRTSFLQKSRDKTKKFNNQEEMDAWAGQIGWFYIRLDTDRTYIWDAETSSYKDVGSADVQDGSVTNAKVSPTAAIDASKIANGSVSNAEFQALDGVTGAIQTQIDDSKKSSNNTIDGTFTATNTAIVTGDTEKVAFQKAQGQIDSVNTLKEDKVNKTSSFQATPDNIKFPTEKLVKDSLDLKANDTAVVHNTGNETVGGVKIFTAFPEVPTATAGDNSTKTANTAFVQGEVADKVKIPTAYATGNLIKYNSTTKQIEDAGATAQDLINLQESFVNLPAYQDFTNVTGTSLTLTTNQNCFLEDGTPAPVSITNASLITSNTTTATLTSDPTQDPRTSAFTSIKLVSSIITAENSNATVTLSGVPRTADKDNIRIYFVIRCKRKDIPVQVQEFPKNVRDNLQSLDVEGLATDDEVNAKIDTTRATVTKYVNDLTGSDTNDGNTEFTPYKTIEKAWTDITPSGQVKVLGAATYAVNHTFASTKTSIKTILEGGTKITGTIGFVLGNTSMQFIGGKVQATINDASSGTQYWNGVDVSGSTFNFSAGGYKQITNSSSAPTAINLTGAVAVATLELNDVLGGITPITATASWMVMWRNSIVTKLGTTGTFVDVNNVYANAVVASQLVLDNLPADGYYILNFSNPSIAGITVGKGDVIYKTGSTRLRIYEFANAPASIPVVNSGNIAHRNTYVKSGDGWVLPATANDLASKQPLDAIAPSIPSASSIDLRNLSGNTIRVTGTTTITEILMDDAKKIDVIFESALALQQGANLFLPNNNQSIAVRAGSSARFVKGVDAANVVRCLGFSNANGLPTNTVFSSLTSTQITLQQGTAPTGQNSQVLGYDTTKGFYVTDHTITGNPPNFLFDVYLKDAWLTSASSQYTPLTNTNTLSDFVRNVSQANFATVVTGNAFDFNDQGYMTLGNYKKIFRTVFGQNISNKPANIPNGAWEFWYEVNKDFNATHSTASQYAKTDGGYFFYRSVYDTNANVNATLSIAPWIPLGRIDAWGSEFPLNEFRNGKQVFVRGFSGTSPAASANTVLVSSGIDDVLNVEGFVKRDGTSQEHDINSVVSGTSAHGSLIYHNTSANSIEMYGDYKSNDYASKPYAASVKYTKL